MSDEPKAILETLLGHLAFESVNVTVQDHDEGLMLDISASDSDRLSGGRHSQVLSDLQYLLNRLVFQQNPEAPKVVLDVDGFRGRQRDRLVQMAQEAAEKVVRWGDIVELQPMNAFDRRIVHNALKDHPSVETHSVEVEGSDKKAILLRPKS